MEAQPMALEIQPVGRFGMMLHQAIDAKKLTLADVAAKVEVTYEHMRKLIRQISFPGKDRAKRLCELLDLDFAEVWEIVTADKIQRKYGNEILPILTKKNAELYLIEMEWPYLKDWMKDALNTIARNFGREARSKTASNSVPVV
jgi:transcriptional regulator with XRE-family HTH domain